MQSPCENSKKQTFSSSIERNNKNNINNNFNNFESMSMDEMKKQYNNNLGFLNKCHEFINGFFKKDLWDFKVPQVPNYFNVLDLYLKQHPEHEFNNNNNNNKVLEKEDDEQIVFDLKQFLPKSICNLANNNIKTNNSLELIGEESINTIVPANVDDGFDFINNYKNLNKLRSLSPSRQSKSDKNVSKKSPSRNDMKALSSTFEEILKTCNEFESKSIEYLLKNDVPLNEPRNVDVPEEDHALENTNNFGNGDQDQEEKRKQELINGLKYITMRRALERESHKVQKPGFNLVEYATKNCKSTSYSPQSSTWSLDSMLNETKRPPKLVDKASQCLSSRKVNELFKKISKDDILDEDRSVSVAVSANVKSSEKSCETQLSSCESVIFSDEEFWRRSERPVGGTWRKFDQALKKEEHLDRKPVPVPSISNPLKLNPKDRSKTDEQILRSIGLFTESGEIRPDVIEILERKRQMSLTQNRTKNVKFRTARKIDFEIEFENGPQRADKNLRANLDSGSGLSVSSSSTVSESDLLNSKWEIKRLN